MEISPQEGLTLNSYCQCITVTVSGDVQLSNKELYFVFEGSSLRHITSVQRIDGNRLRIPIPDHDVPEVVQVSLIVRAEDGIHPLATSQFEYRQDQGQYVAEFLLFSTINDEAAEFLAALSPESIGLRDVDIAELDNRLATGLKLTNILPRNWSLLRHNSDGKVFIVNQDTILHFAARFGLLQTLKFLLQASDAQRGLMVKNKRNELVIDVAKKYGHRSIENYMQRNIVDDDNDCIGIYLLESYAKVLINGLAMITRQKAKTDFSPNEDIKKIQQLQDFAADEPLEKIYADNALLRQFKNSLLEREFGIDHITIQSITPQSSAIDRVLNTFKAYIQSSNFDHKGKDDMRVNYFHGSSYNNNNYGSVKDTSKGFVRWLFGGGSHLQNLNRDEHELSDDDRVNAAEIEKYKSKRGNRRHTWVNILNGGPKGKQENPSELDFESDYDNEVGLNIRLDQPLPSNDDDEFDYDFDIHAVSEDINGGGASSDTGANFLGDRLSDNMHSLKRIAKSTEDLREASAIEFYNEWDDEKLTLPPRLQQMKGRPMKKKNITMEAELKRAAKGQPSFDKFTRYPRGSIVRDEVGYHSDRDDPERSMLARGKSKIHASAATSSGVGRRLTIFSKSIKSGKTRKTTHQFVPGGKYIINATCEYCKKIVKGSESLMCIACRTVVHANGDCKDNVPSCLKFIELQRANMENYRQSNQKKLSHKDTNYDRSLVDTKDYQRRAPIQADNKKYVEYKRKSARSAKTKSGNSNSPQISPTKNPYLQLQFGNQNQPENDQNELQILSAKGKPLRQRSNTEDSDTTTYIQPLKSAQSDQNIQDNPDEEVTFHMVEESRDDSYDIDPDLALKEEVEAWNATVSKTILKKMNKEEVKRQDVIFEFIKTEKNHLRTLKIIQLIFMRGMLKEAGLQEELVRRMFPGIERMIELSNIFVEKLTERQCQSDVVNSLGDIIVEHFTKNGAEIDENYGNFCSYHIQSLALYKDLLKQRKFSNFIKKCDRDPYCRRLSIPECFTLVTQRLTKYPILIQAVIKSTPEHFPDYAYLNQALILVKSTATNVDERIQRYKSIQRLKQIQSKLDQKALSTIQGTPIKKLNLASGHFMLLLEDSLIVRGARGKSIDVQALLLNNLIVLLQEKDQKFYLLPIEQKSPIVPIGKAMIRENAADPKAIYMVYNSDQKPQMYELICRSESQKKGWIQQINNAVQKATPIEDSLINDDGIDGCIDDQSENSSLLSPFDQLLEQSKIVDEQIIKLIAEREKVFQEMFNAFTPEDEEQKDKIRKEYEKLDSKLLERTIEESFSMLAAVSSGKLIKTPQSMPKRTETFHGFDHSSRRRMTDPDLRPIAIRRRKTMDSKDETDSFIIEKSDSQDSSSIPSSIATTPCNLSPAASERHLYSAVTLSECINRLLLITSQKDNEIESLKGRISCSDNKIKDLDEQLRMKDQKIKEMNTTISNNVQKPSLSLQEVIRKQQTQIVELQMDQKEWEDHQALISRQEEKIKEQQDNINEWKEKYEQLQDELSKKPIRPVIPEIIKTGNVPDNNKVITRKHSAPLSYNAVKRASNLNTSRRHSTFIPSPCLPRAKIIPNQPISTLNDRNNLSTQGTEFLSTSLPNTSSISAISGPTVVDKDVEENSSFSDDEVNKENDSEGLSDSEMIFF